MLGLDRLNGTQKAILGLSTTFVVYFLILVVADVADGSFDERYNLYYIIGFSLFTGLYLRSKLFPDSRLKKIEFPIWIVLVPTPFTPVTRSKADFASDMAAGSSNISVSLIGTYRISNSKSRVFHAKSHGPR